MGGDMNTVHKNTQYFCKIQAGAKCILYQRLNLVKSTESKIMKKLGFNRTTSYRK